MAITTKPANIGTASGDDAPVAASVAALITDAPVPHPTLWKTFAAMMAREFRVLGRNAPSTFIRAVMQPLLFAFVFAYVLPKIGSGFGSAGAGSSGITFSTILVPGLMGSMFLMQGMFGTTMPLVMEFSWQRTIEDRALAPVPIRVLAIQKITAGAIQAFIGAAIVFPVVYWVHAPGQGPHIDVTSWFLLGAVMVFSSTLTALGCVYYPWSALHVIRWLQILVLINPMVYMTEGLRAALTPSIGHMPLWAIMLALVGGTAVFGYLGIRSFRNRVVG